MTNEAMISSLREYAEWAEANIWEVPIDLPDTLKAAADLIEKTTDPTGIDEIGLSVRSFNALYRWGIRFIRDLAKLDADALVKIPGIGKGAAKEIMEKVKEVYK